ncbi:ribonuclease H-like domain-containing protein [Rossellomorea vietnamensis]|uniref:Ribonuclease H-like domain-containing protein n=1 Tax=Rossellomorea vietnamensis TaxID=218284 RepID=A0ACD4C8X2_9BACI|nr:ribonuclease H-like domain-containing protein [Rossellomorea vietnamensis]UXH44689.1 ribonuclease H-like domain-containing protein [Rossellomorea vietnamensis]WQI96030.1 ribonuclease H-like domain-containing protein [Rossellomorea vietnamensis]
MSLKNKLTRMKKHIIREEDGEPAARPADHSADLPFWDLWKENGTTAYFLDDDFCLVREKRYPIHHQHGDYTFKDFIKAVDAWQGFTGEHPLSSKGLSHEDMFFFDTETTGLGGGVGNTIFLLGHGRVTDKEVIVTQHFLPQPGSEIPLYHSFLSNVDYNTLVTYNGKAFDWPQVKTRHTLIKDHVPKLPGFGHFDLYHGSRRLFKHKLDSVKLINVERNILGFNRIDDVPGYLAPMIYFDYIERRDPEGIFKVMTHNELDILSLITLYTHLTFQLLNVHDKATGHERFEVGRWLEYTGNGKIAKERYEEIIKENGEPNFKAVHQLALQYKKEKREQKAIELWEGIHENAPVPIRKVVLLELAKLYEHKTKDLQRALEMCSRLLALKESIGETNGKHHTIIGNLNHRKARIEKKIDKHIGFVTRRSEEENL